MILATAPLLVYLAGEFDTFRQVASHVLVEVAEAIGAGGYVVIGLLGILAGAPFLQKPWAPEQLLRRVREVLDADVPSVAGSLPARNT